MIIYKNTFENIKTINCNFPLEDQYYATDNLAVVADGITRDPIGVNDISKISFEELIKLYPRPSGAQMASEAIADSFKNFCGDLKEQLIIANKRVKKLNDKFITNCDYLQNDYYGSVASCVYIENNILYYAYICDCGVIVYDKNGNIKFQTEDDKELYSDPYINKIGIPWHLPEARVIVRRDYRNNLKNIQDDKCVSYGAITGEESAISFIKTGSLKLEFGDIIIVYSDGFVNFLREKSFIYNLLNFTKSKFESYVEDLAKKDYTKYGKEKTLILLKYDL